MPRTETTTRTLYKFDELSEAAQDAAIENLYSINVGEDWHESTYEDAANVGLKITSFDIDRGSYCKGEFLASAEETAHKIETEHGDTCETYKTAKEYLATRDAIIEKAPKDEDGEWEDEYQLDRELDEADEYFLKSLLEDYLSLLRKEYEYQTSREAIKDTIEANEYEFTEDGKLA